MNLPGVSVETTFSLERADPPYGFKGGVRPDVVLRNAAGEVLAIYDVKTGGAEIDQPRAAELRAKTGAGPNVPVIEMHPRRGITWKCDFIDTGYEWIRRMFSQARRGD
jgi:hypothetical protein